MIKPDKRALYSKLAPYYDFIAPLTTGQECMFLNNVFQSYKKKIAKVLDLGCGTGRHSCLLSRMGYKVIGIDLAEEMLRVARKKCPKVEFRKMDFTNPKFPDNYFDASICMWTTISHVRTEEKFRKFVKRIAQITKTLLIIDSSNYENPTRNRPLIKGRNVIKLPKATIESSMIRRYNAKTRFRDDEYTTTLTEKGKKGIVLKEKERVRMWSAEEMEALLKPNFKVLKIYGDYSLGEKYFPKTSKRKIVVAEKTSNKNKQYYSRSG